MVATAVGYSGGHIDEPTYRLVCGKDTGHAEVVLVEFDPTVVSYERILDVFFQIHESSYWSEGGQYRSAIFYFDDRQRHAAERLKEALQVKGEPVKTEITAAGRFWMGEDYHQQYYEKRGLGGGSGAGCIQEGI